MKITLSAIHSQEEIDEYLRKCNNPCSFEEGFKKLEEMYNKYNKEPTELQRVNSWIKLQNNLNKAFQNGDFALLEKINNIMEVYNNEK